MSCQKKSITTLIENTQLELRQPHYFAKVVSIYGLQMNMVMEG